MLSEDFINGRARGSKQRNNPRVGAGRVYFNVVYFKLFAFQPRFSFLLQFPYFYFIYPKDAGRDWGQEEKRKTEDEMAGWHHRLDACESE